MLSACVWSIACERLISRPVFTVGNPSRQELRKAVQESMSEEKEKEKAAPRGASCIITHSSFYIYSLVVLYFFVRLGAFTALPLLTLPHWLAQCPVYC